MFPADLYTTTWSAVALVAVSTVGVYSALVIFSRMAGLRSFAQMTNFDMAATVALGSMVATTAISSKVSLVQGVIGLAVLFAAQALIARLRGFRSAEAAVDARPLLLMLEGEVLHESLNRAQMTLNDLRSKLRLAGITNYDQVAALVLESTGETSLLTRPRDGREVDPDLLYRVRGMPARHHTA